MPIFELQNGDETFEVDAPDMQSAISAIGGGGKSVSGFFSNLASNAGDVAGGLYHAASQPIETAKNLGKLGVGMVQEFIPGQQQYESEYADPFYKGLAKDAGFKRGQNGIEWDPSQLAQNAYERPVDLALDAATVVAPFEGLPGKAGTVARLANPLNAAGKAVTTVAKVPAKIGKYVAGEMSGMGPQAIAEAYRSGKVGGVEGQAFRAGMRDSLDPEAPVDLARGVVGDLKRERSQAYTGAMQGVKANQTPLQFQPIETAFNSVANVKSFRGKSVKPSVYAARQKVRDALDEWKADPGAWTAEGFDALKQRIQDIGESLNPMTEGAARHMVGTVAQAVKREIIKQAPEYGKIMAAYEKASNIITELQKTMSLGKKASYDTALRKLQSVLRNNAFTNWSARAKLAQLIQQRAPELMPMLSGQSASAIMPRGLPGKLLSGGISGAGAIAAFANPYTLVPAAAAAALGSPRLVGEVAHGAGRLAGGAQSTVGSIPRPVRAIGKTGVAATPRMQSLDQAKNVLSAPVLDHIKKAPGTRGLLNDWLKARHSGQGVDEATQMLAAGIMQELKIEDQTVYDRIVRELSQARGA